MKKKEMSAKELAKYIDSTLLSPLATDVDIKKLCREAKKYGFASVCVFPSEVAKCKELLKNSKVKVCTVIGFPLGKNTPEVKVFEAKKALEDGADELDFVANGKNLKGLCGDGKYDRAKVTAIADEVVPFLDEVSRVSEEQGRPILTKLIIECCNLTEIEKIAACVVAAEFGFDFVKTSTGFAKGGATVKDVQLLDLACEQWAEPGEGDWRVYVKAAGGVRTRKQALAMIAAGAKRLGTSAAAKIMEEVE